jgi:hypothetical protein
MLTFNKGRPIAIIEGGKYNNKIIHLFDPTRTCCEKCNFKKIQQKLTKTKCCKNCNKDTCKNYEDKEYDYGDRQLFDVLGEDFVRQFKKKMSVSDLNKIKVALKHGEKPEDNSLDDVYEKCKKEYNDKIMKEFTLHDEGIIRPLPNYNKPERSYIAGPSDSGKSYYTRKYIEQLKKVFPKRDIFLLSDVDEDHEIDKIKPTRIPLNEEFLNDSVTPESLKNSIVIFDDIDSIPDKNIKEKVDKLKDSLLKRGRHEDISVIVTNHQLTDYKRTREIMNESNLITFFPKSGSSNGIKYMLKTYVGMDTKQIKKVFDLPSTWVTVYKRYPMYLMYEKGVYLL